MDNRHIIMVVIFLSLVQQQSGQKAKCLSNFHLMGVG